MTLPIPEKILQQHVAVLGKTRSGKSSVLRDLVEHLLRKRQPVCIIDPKGDWWGIKLAADGEGPGFPVAIFGGEHADVPINELAGAHVAELFATGNRPCLIDLGGWMVGERTRFWIDFASSLFKHTRGQRWLVVDEFHNFAPKGKIFDVDAGKALHWSNRLASEGLGKGIAMLFASQRPQKVHNDALTSAETLIAMRVIHPADRAAISDWIKGCGNAELGSQVLDGLAQMPRGMGWVWSPEIGFGPERIGFPMFKTYDSFRAQSAGDTRGLKGWAEVDLDEVKTKLAAVMKEAEQNDPKALKHRIAELQRQLSSKTVATVLPAAVHVNSEQMRALKEENRQLRADMRGVTQYADKLAAKLDRIKSITLDMTEPPVFKAVAAPVKVGGSARFEAMPPPRRQISGNGAGNPEVTKGDRLVLTALAQAGGSRSVRQLAILAGYPAGGSSMRAIMAHCRSMGWVDGTADKTIITGLGVEALGTYDPLPTGQALLDHWLRELPKGAAEVLRVVAEKYPDGVAADEIARRTNYEAGGSSMRAALARLRALELVSPGNPVVAAEEFFEGA